MSQFAVFDTSRTELEMKENSKSSLRALRRESNKPTRRILNAQNVRQTPIGVKDRRCPAKAGRYENSGAPPGRGAL